MSDYQPPLKADAIRRICLENGLEIPDTQWNLLEKWAALLLEVNQKVNLISRKETDLLWEKQILPCLALLIFRKFSPAAEVCDFGTGGGLPGMILAIVRPDFVVVQIFAEHQFFYRCSWFTAEEKLLQACFVIEIQAGIAFQ